MPKKDFLKHLTDQLSDALPSHLSAFKKDIEKNYHAILSKTLAKFDLVTREEFDVQSKVLSRTRKKVDELEKQLHELELLLKTKHHK